MRTIITILLITSCLLGYSQFIQFPNKFSERFCYINDSQSAWPWLFVQTSDSSLNGASSSFILTETGETFTASALWGAKFKGLITHINGDFQDFRYFIVNKSSLYKVDRDLKVFPLETPVTRYFESASSTPILIDHSILFHPDLYSNPFLLDLLNPDLEARQLPYPVFLFARIDSLRLLAFANKKIALVDNQYNLLSMGDSLVVPLDGGENHQVILFPDSTGHFAHYLTKDSSNNWIPGCKGRVNVDHQFRNFSWRCDAYKIEYVSIRNQGLLKGNIHTDLSNLDKYEMFSFKQVSTDWTYLNEYYLNSFSRLNLSTGFRQVWPTPGYSSLKEIGDVWAFEGKVFAATTSEALGSQQLFRFYPESGTWNLVSNFSFPEYRSISHVYPIGSKILVRVRLYGSSNAFLLLLNPNENIDPVKPEGWTRILSPAVINNPTWPNGGPAILMGMDVGKEGQMVTLSQVSNHSDLYWTGTKDTLQIEKSLLRPINQWTFGGGQLISYFDKNKHLKWSKFFSGYYHERKGSIKLTPQGKIIIASWNRHQTYVDSIKLEAPGQNLSHITQLNSQGQLEWILPLIRNGSNYKVSEMVVDENGNSYMLLEIDGIAQVGTLEIYSVRSTPAWYVVKISKDGAPLWATELTVTSDFKFINHVKISYNQSLKQVNALIQEICEGCFGFTRTQTSDLKVSGIDVTDGRLIWQNLLSSYEGGLTVSNMKSGENGALHLIGNAAKDLRMNGKIIHTFQGAGLDAQPFWIRLNPFGVITQFTLLQMPALFPNDFEPDNNGGLFVFGRNVQPPQKMEVHHFDFMGSSIFKKQFSKPYSNNYINSNPNLFYVADKNELILGDFFREGYQGVPYAFSAYFNKVILMGVPYMYNDSKAVFSQLEKGFSLFPNPAENEVTLFLNHLRFEIARIDIISTEGKVVKTENLNFKLEDYYKVNVDDLLPGLYIVRVLADKKTAAIKMIKRRS